MFPTTSDTRVPSAARRSSFFSALFVILVVPGCLQQMADQPKVDPLEASEFFNDGNATRPQPPHTVPTAPPFAPNRLEEPFASSDDTPTAVKMQERPPARLLASHDSLELLQRGQERFAIYCAPCHGLSGQGDGMVPRRGFPFPPSYHSPRLREKPIGYFFSVATHGHGQMPSYGEMLSETDRWAVAGYVRALQLSQYAPLELLDADEKQQLGEDDE